MRKLIFALAAAGTLACSVPAHAQTYWYATPMGLTTGLAPWGYGGWGAGRDIMASPGAPPRSAPTQQSLASAFAG